jgi:hypothetical protein
MKKRMPLLALLTIITIAALAAYPENVDELRTRGQLAVDDLHARWSEAPPAERAELQAALDRVCAQKDCHASRLYWFTDLEQAKEAARTSGRPILSLHLLGRLDEELSCANSRFFRTLLYSDDRISALLRDRFVLHWHSVRAVPRVTIELGDGRVIRQTITGNSAHYFLAGDGQVLDVLPGLYSPDAFRAQLEDWLQLHRTLDRSSAARSDTLWRYHEMRRNEGNLRAQELGIDRTVYDGQQPVWVAQRQSMSKMATERPLLRQLKTPRGGASEPILPRQGVDVQFSESTLALMRSKQTLTDAVMENLRQTIATDTERNEYDLHLRVHEWFVRGEVKDLPSLNERVYDELFLTPSSDPWLGLAPDSVFLAIGG